MASGFAPKVRQNERMTPGIGQGLGILAKQSRAPRVQRPAKAILQHAWRHSQSKGPRLWNWSQTCQSYAWPSRFPPRANLTPNVHLHSLHRRKPLVASYGTQVAPGLSFLPRLLCRAQATTVNFNTCGKASVSALPSLRLEPRQPSQVQDARRNILTSPSFCQEARRQLNDDKHDTAKTTQALAPVSPPFCISLLLSSSFCIIHSYLYPHVTPPGATVQAIALLFRNRPHLRSIPSPAAPCPLTNETLRRTTRSSPRCNTRTPPVITARLRRQLSSTLSDREGLS
ncbi:hypothetical protein LIA77_07504 [Sarocladium implicatum]|nr:hypothetical protein LIA77_07504 [Sarocladium implicatum]